MKALKLLFAGAFVLFVAACQDGATAPNAGGPDAELGVGPWTAQVTGGGMSLVGSTPLWISINAKMQGGASSGQVEYDATSVGFKWHGVVDGLIVYDGGQRAEICGEVTQVQAGTDFAEGDRFGIAIKEGGSSSGDGLRQNATVIDCDQGNGNYFGGYPATMQDGNYTIRSR